MTVSPIELSADQLLKAVTRLSQSELDRFIARVVRLRPSVAARRLSRRESELLLKINQGIPVEFQRRYDELVAEAAAIGYPTV